MSVRLSGGLGPLRVSIPLLPRRGRRRGSSGGGGALVAMLKGIGMLCWWTLVYCLYWPMRLLYWELPRWAWREVQRRRSAATPGGQPSSTSSPRA